jgi:hypothetical protein
MPALLHITTVRQAPPDLKMGFRYRSRSDGQSRGSLSRLTEPSAPPGRRNPVMSLGGLRLSGGMLDFLRTVTVHRTT